MEGGIVGGGKMMAPVEEGRVSGTAAVKKVGAPVDPGRLVADTKEGVVVVAVNPHEPWNS